MLYFILYVELLLGGRMAEWFLSSFRRLYSTDLPLIPWFWLFFSLNFLYRNLILGLFSVWYCLEGKYLLCSSKGVLLDDWGCPKLNYNGWFLLAFVCRDDPVILNSRKVLFILNSSGFSSVILLFLSTSFERTGKVLKVNFGIYVFLTVLGSWWWFLAD